MKPIYIRITITYHQLILVVVTKKFIFDVLICKRASSCNILSLGVKMRKTEYIYFSHYNLTRVRG